MYLFIIKKFTMSSFLLEIKVLVFVQQVLVWDPLSLPT